MITNGSRNESSAGTANRRGRPPSSEDIQAYYAETDPIMSVGDICSLYHLHSTYVGAVKSRYYYDGSGTRRTPYHHDQSLFTLL